jgi:hypothetical protein
MISSFIVLIAIILISLICFLFRHRKIPTHETIWDFISQSVLILTGSNLIYKISNPAGSLLFPELAPYEPIYLFSIGVFVLYTSLKKIYEKIKKGK